LILFGLQISFDIFRIIIYLLISYYSVGKVRFTHAGDFPFTVDR